MEAEISGCEAHTRKLLFYDWLKIPSNSPMNAEMLKRALCFRPSPAISIPAWKEDKDFLYIPRRFFTPEQERKLKKDLDVDIIPDEDLPKMFPEKRYQTHFELRPFQIAPKNSLLQGSGILCLACGKGKTVIALHALREMNTPGLIIVPTVDLAYQWVERIREHTDINEEDIGWIQGPMDKWKIENKTLTVGIIHSVSNHYERIPIEWRKQWGVVVFDEVHRLGAPYFNKVAPIGFGYRWGLSATPFRSDGLDSLYRYHIGDVRFTDLRHENIPHVYFVPTRTQPTKQVFDRYGDLNLAQLYNCLAADERRQEQIIEIAASCLSRGKKLIVLSERVSHIKSLTLKMEAIAHGKIVGTITGKTPGRQRPEILASSDVIFASTSIARDGIDKKDLSVVIICMPFTDKGRFQQIVGRAQRGKNPEIYVLEDENISPCVAMCRKLKRHLTSLEYPYSRLKENDLRRIV